MLEKEIAFCTEKVGQEGTSLYYALLFQTPVRKAFWLGCFALTHEVRRAAVQQLEAGLSQVKLGWWRNALVDVRNKRPQHPVMLAIGPEVIRAVPDDNWAALIEGVVNGAQIHRHASERDWTLALDNNTRPWLPVLSAALQVPPARLEPALAFWVRSLQLTQLLRLAKYVEEGFQPLPMDWLQAHGVHAEQLKKREHNADTRALFEEAGAFVMREAGKHWQATDPELRLQLRPLRALYRMRVAEWRNHARAGYMLLTEQKVINPWKKFSTAWTTQVLRR